MLGQVNYYKLKISLSHEVIRYRFQQDNSWLSFREFNFNCDIFLYHIGHNLMIRDSTINNLKKNDPAVKLIRMLLRHKVRTKGREFVHKVGLRFYIFKSAANCFECFHYVVSCVTFDLQNRVLTQYYIVRTILVRPPRIAILMAMKEGSQPGKTSKATNQ